MAEGRIEEEARAATAEEAVLRVVEERARVGVEAREAGLVRVSTRTETVPQELSVDLADLAVEVERVPVGRVVERAEAPRTEETEDGELTVLPVYEERAVLLTQLVLVEEVRVLRRRIARRAQVPVELRRQTAVVERLSPDAAAQAGAEGGAGHGHDGHDDPKPSHP